MQTRVSRGLVISGGVLAGNAYLLSVAGGLAAVTDNNGDDTIGLLVVPIVGPFLAAGLAETASLSKSRTSGSGALLIIDGLAQIGGSVLFIAGMATERRVVVRNDLASFTAPEIFVGPTSASVRVRF